MNDPQPATQDELSDAPGTAIKPGVDTPADPIAPAARDANAEISAKDSAAKEAAAKDAVAKQRRVSDGARTPVLPDCCNFGIALRIVAPLNMAAFVFAVALSSGFIDAINHFVDIALLLEPITLASLVVLCLVRKRVNGFRVPLQWLVALAVPVIFSLPVAWLSFSLLAGPNFTGGHAWWIAVRVLLTLGIAWGVVEFLRLRARAYSPSLAEARLQALQARIRPHFLFNSLNTVLGLMRSDPRRAERTLENLADLFRVFMRDTRELVPLDEEVVTCQQYLAIEQLRLGERLQISWDLAEMAGDALLPSLLLQPLVENSVHHGIEPRTEPGEIWIKISKPGERVRVEIVNPAAVSQNAIRPGNQMALSNVRERLMLLYDMEAELKTTEEGGSFRLLLEFPYRKEKRRRDVRRHFNPDR